MQVTLHNHDALTRHRQRLQENAKADRERATALESTGANDKFEASKKKNSAEESREQGRVLDKESDRLRRNGREQSLRGLNRLTDSSDKYSESFSKQEQGLGDLQSGLNTITAANQSKSSALAEVNTGLSEQALHNQAQSAGASALESNAREDRDNTEIKQSSAGALEQNLSDRDGALNTQAERIGDFILAGADFDQASAVKQSGASKLEQGIVHRVQAEVHNDTKTLNELQQTWGQEDAERHQKAEEKYFFSSILESVKATASNLNARFHESVASRGEQQAAALDAQASQMKAQAEVMFEQGQMLEHSGRHHLAIAQQLKCCPCTYCQGLALERQGLAELAQAQTIKAQAQSMRSEAQEKAIEAETARVKAEQAREVSNELKVEGHGQEIRSDILKQRSESHQTRSAKAAESAEKAAQRAADQAEKASQEKRTSSQLQEHGTQQWSQGMSQQKAALAQQGQALQGHRDSLKTETTLQGQAASEVDKTARALSVGRSLIGRNRNLVSALMASVASEVDSQEKVQGGIDNFQSGVAQSVEGTERSQQAAKLLEEARKLELEGLRLQNSGQKMLLSARPKMADAAKLSAQSFEAFNKADRQEREAEKLIASGEQKLSAAAILRDKARAYESLAESI